MLLEMQAHLAAIARVAGREDARVVLSEENQHAELAAFGGLIDELHNNGSLFLQEFRHITRSHATPIQNEAEVFDSPLCGQCPHRLHVRKSRRTQRGPDEYYMQGSKPTVQGEPPYISMQRVHVNAIGSHFRVECPHILAGGRGIEKGLGKETRGHFMVLGISLICRCPRSAVSPKNERRNVSPLIHGHVKVGSRVAQERFEGGSLEQVSQAPADEPHEDEVDGE
jgi:hypothetical protein